MEPISARALERRLKRRLRKAEQHFFAPCAPGFEAALAAEVAALPEVALSATERGGVSFSGPLDTVYHANLWLRSAHRVLLRIDDFPAKNEPTLYDRVRRLPWELYLGYAEAYRLRVSSKRSRLAHQRAVIATVAAGIGAALDPLGLRPEPREDAGITLQLRLHEDRCTLSLDTSGEHLHKRGYRPQAGAAPLRETLAASILLGLPRREAGLILDPMCGSGTLLVEAALLSTQTAPGLLRSFAFEALPLFQASKWARLRREAEARRQESVLRLVGNDLDAEALELAQASARRAGVGELITWQRGDARALTPPAARGLLLANVPYGLRLGTPGRAAALLEGFAAQLAERFGGWSFAFVTRDSGWLARPGLQVGSSLRFRNGGVPVALVTGRVTGATPG